MTQPLRIAVADDEPDMRDYFSRILPRLGHRVVALAQNGADLVAQCRTSRPDLIITDIKMPGMDGIEAATRIYQEMPVPVILVSAYHDPELLTRAEVDHIMGYLVKPIKQADLGPVIAQALQRFAQRRPPMEAAERPPLDDPALIERAKEALMARAGLDESGACQPDPLSV